MRSEHARDRRFTESLRDRAAGRTASMRCSLAAAEVIVHNGPAGPMSLLDVGCACGHYLAPLREAIGSRLTYTGLDLEESRIAIARQLFPRSAFVVGSVDVLPFPPQSFDVVLCANLLLHLDDIRGPLTELCIVARSLVVIRTLVSTRTCFTTQPDHSVLARSEVPEEESQTYNVYASKEIRKLLLGLDRVRAVSFVPDYRSGSLANRTAGPNTTEIVSGEERLGSLVLTWHFVVVTLDG